MDETKSINDENRSARFWDRRAATYDKTEAENEQLHTTIVERSREYLGTDQVVLDLGCGTGHSPIGSPLTWRRCTVYTSRLR